ncbi:murein biosynthesis integral membrane protein MurJ [Kocuria sp.]|uniref:murein biosynthesis integral membrane protein MurJ n=1 Tax=Kocuria sp. TaxID=1871328 RepID=UPI0026DD5B20|nr:lipid II flippase MurJ [Kocuria sp.]MDO4919106.1 lipid II flippase MurJ [Kocuria sp.]
MASSGARSSAIMASGTLVSRILGFVKTFLITVAIGSAATMADVFQLANTLPNLIYVLIAGGVFNAVLVPQIIKASKAEDEGADYISRLLTLAVIALLVITGAVLLCVGPIMRLMGPGWSEAQLAMGTTFALITFPQIFFYGLYTVVGQVLNAKGAFGAYMWAPVLNNVIAIASLLVFVQQFGPFRTHPHSLENWSTAQTFWLVGMATAGVAAQAFVLFWPLARLGLHIRPRFGWRGIGLSTAGRLGGWTLATGVIANLAFMALYRTAAIPTGARPELAPGPGGPPPMAGTAVLDQATMLYALPHGVIGLSIATVLFNRMAAAATEGDKESLVSSLSSSLRVTGVATVFCMVALIVYAGPLGMLFSGGVPAAGAVIGQVITVIAIGAPFMSTAFMLGRAFYAREDARTPFFVQLAVSAFTVVGAVVIARVFPPEHMVFAIAACYAVQNILATVVYHYALKRRIGDYGLSRIVASHARILAASLVSAAAGAVVLWLLGGYNTDGFPWHGQLSALLSTAVGGIAMALVYAVALKLFRVQEFTGLLAPLRARIRR